MMMYIYSVYHITIHVILWELTQELLPVDLWAIHSCPDGCRMWHADMKCNCSELNTIDVMCYRYHLSKSFITLFCLILIIPLVLLGTIDPIWRSSVYVRHQGPLALALSVRKWRLLQLVRLTLYWLQIDITFKKYFPHVLCSSIRMELDCLLYLIISCGYL
jgi:hypothetical protein